jgi:hypothetical protein
MITVQYGSPTGLTEIGAANYTQSDFGGSTEEAGDSFGYSLAVADFGGSGTSDLAIGAPFEDVGAVWNAGSVSVVYGPFGFASAEYLTQGASIGNGTTSEDSDHFAYTLGAGDFDGDGFGDLAIGTPRKDIGAIVDAGAVSVVYGKLGSGVDPEGSQVWHQDSPGIQGIAEAEDYFGSVSDGSRSHSGNNRPHRGAHLFSRSIWVGVLDVAEQSEDALTPPRTNSNDSTESPTVLPYGNFSVGRSLTRRSTEDWPAIASSFETAGLPALFSE